MVVSSKLFELDNLVERINSKSSFQHLPLSTKKAQPTFTSKNKRQGPRISYDGVYDEQRILWVQREDDREMDVFITMLSAGFIIGRMGQSIQHISQVTGATISSYNKKYEGREIRVFNVFGNEDALCHTLKIFVAAVNRHKDLLEGKFKGQFVGKEQIVEGISFHYEAPPEYEKPLSARTDKSSGSPRSPRPVKFQALSEQPLDIVYPNTQQYTSFLPVTVPLYTTQHRQPCSQSCSQQVAYPPSYLDSIQHHFNYLPNYSGSPRILVPSPCYQYPNSQPWAQPYPYTHPYASPLHCQPHCQYQYHYDYATLPSEQSAYACMYETQDMLEHSYISCGH